MKRLISLLLLTLILPLLSYLNPPAKPRYLVVQPWQTVTISGNIKFDSIVVYGKIIADPKKNLYVDCNAGNIVLKGKGEWVDTGAAPSIVHQYQISHINENTFVVSGMEVLHSNPGFWIMDSAKMTIKGAPKTPWSYAFENLFKGTTVIHVNQHEGWKPGDEILITPTRKPEDKLDWDDRLNISTDPFEKEFERPHIKSINGDEITLDRPFQYDHLSVYNDLEDTTYYPEVAMLTQNVKLQGTATGRTHIMVHSGVPQDFENVEVSYMGPRNGGGRTFPVTGNYVFHEHMNYDGSRGTLIKNCSFHDLGAHVIVPHESYGITIDSNVMFNTCETMIWWNEHARAHDLTVNGNLLALCRYNGKGCKTDQSQCNENSGGMQIGQGDDQSYTNNTTVYCHWGDIHEQADYIWPTNNTAVVHFEHNVSHSSRTGIFVWDNGPLNHLIQLFICYNDERGMYHGAYNNSYDVEGSQFFNAVVEVPASAGNTFSSFIRCSFNMNNSSTDGIPLFFTCSPAAPLATNKVIQCRFSNYKQAAVGLLFHDLNGAGTYKKNVELIQCSFDNYPHVYLDPATNNKAIQGGDCSIYENNTDGRKWDDGTGLTTEYYNGVNFNQPAFRRVDKMIYFMQWNTDVNLSPDGPHYLLSEQFSTRSTGQVKAPLTGYYTFDVAAAGGYKLWLNGQLILNKWFEHGYATDKDASTQIYLKQGQYHDIKLEYFNQSGNKGLMLYWYCNGMKEGHELVPMTQLYPSTNTTYKAAASSPVKTSMRADCSVTEEKVYPNPSKGTFFIKSKPGTLLLITDITGRQIGKNKLSTGNDQFSIQTPGVYFFNHQKIVVIK